MRNSTINPKFGECPMCANGKLVALVGGMCMSHYWLSRRLKSASRKQEKEIVKEDSLQVLVTDLDLVFSKYIRLKYADENGMVKCYTCPTVEPWTMITNGHYISRQHMFLRWDERNCKPQCDMCNVKKHGNIKAYTKQLQLEYPGLTDILFEESATVYKWTREELKSMIFDYTKKVTAFLKTLI